MTNKRKKKDPKVIEIIDQNTPMVDPPPAIVDPEGEEDEVNNDLKINNPPAFATWGQKK